ncbi:FAD:protein FMN transferase [Bacillus sp. FJAT-29814]|uniref:FAD:protein FMN transferase n=1 Tax=Bacillus sp. FJAT-29814 TaxID=1729688 RepID=UPI000836BB3D|nr:FAD:protein FMN transferase [Bacillus sp. FJAT-29814]
MIDKREERKELDCLTIQIMNTDFYIAVTDCLQKNWKDVISGWLHYVEKEWSRFRTDNELARINQLKTGEKVIVSPPLIDVLLHAESYRQKSGGFFSPYLLPQLQFHGYAHSFPFRLGKPETGKPPAVFDVQISPFRFNRKASTVERAAPGQIDLGGIGKGYAVQATANWLKNIGGAKTGIVDGGGDIIVWSDGSKTWTIGVANPHDTDLDITQYRIQNGSLATSNIIYRSWMQGNEKKHHLINGKTGQPVGTTIIQATAITDNCLDAEVMAKLCFMEKGQTLASLLTAINPNYTILLVNENGNMIHSSGGAL